MLAQNQKQGAKLLNKTWCCTDQGQFPLHSSAPISRPGASVMADCITDAVMSDLQDKAACVKGKAVCVQTQAFCVVRAF